MKPALSNADILAALRELNASSDVFQTAMLFAVAEVELELELPAIIVDRVLILTVQSTSRGDWTALLQQQRQGVVDLWHQPSASCFSPSPESQRYASSR